MSLVDGVGSEPVDPHPPPDGFPRLQPLPPRRQVLEVVHGQEGVGVVAGGDALHPRQDGHVGYGVLIAADVLLAALGCSVWNPGFFFRWVYIDLIFTLKFEFVVICPKNIYRGKKRKEYLKLKNPRHT